MGDVNRIGREISRSVLLKFAGSASRSVQTSSIDPLSMQSARSASLIVTSSSMPEATICVPRCPSKNVSASIESDDVHHPCSTPRVAAVRLSTTPPPTMAPSTTLINKIKVQLKLSVSRLRMVQAKDAALAKVQRRAMAQLLEQGKDESARIRVENIIRSDMNTELLEILELYCELLTARAGLLEQKECDPGLEEAVKSIIFAAPKVEGVKELGIVRGLLAEKYGKEFTLEAVENRDGKVAERVASRLRVEPPSKELVEAYLSTIAEAYGIDWPRGSKARRKAEEEAGGDDDEDDDEPSGGQKVKSLEGPLSTEELSRATPPRDLGPRSPVSVVPPSPSTDNVRPKIILPGPPDLKPSKKMVDATKAKEVNGEKKEAGPGGKIPDVDELTKRFAQLKR